MIECTVSCYVLSFSFVGCFVCAAEQSHAIPCCSLLGGHGGCLASYREGAVLIS